ncbi:MAG: hypothetical protein ABSG81_05410 [Acidimicrobiales bacterium]
MADTTLGRAEVASERKQLFGTFAYLMGSQGSTAVLGLAFWAFVTHFFRASDVGLAFAASSTATLLSTIGILGVATFLIAEMGSMEPISRRAVLSTAIAVVCGTVGLLTVGTLLLSHSLGSTLAAIGRDPLVAVLFLAGAIATVAAVTFDSAAIGIHRGSAQLSRGITASLLKFAFVGALIVAGSRTSAGLIFAWAAGVIVSLFACHPLLRLARTPPGGGSIQARVAITRRYSLLSLNHHVLNLSINSVSYFVPVVAAALIAPRQYAFFATAQTLSSVVLIVPYLLTLALFAETSNDERLLQRHVRRTLPMGMAAAVAIVGVVAVMAPFVLRLFGSLYALHGTATLRILILTGPSYVIKDHYVAIRRTQGKLGLASRVLTMGTLAEVAGAALGGALFGLYGLCTGWVIVAALEACALLPIVLGVYRNGTPAVMAADALRTDTSTGQPPDAAPRPRPRRGGLVPRPDRQLRPRTALDPAMPALLFRMPGYPLHHGGVGAVRSLGRAGVPVYAVVEDRYTPAALSRYLTGSVVARPGDGEDPARLLERILEFGAGLGRRALIVCTDDAAAVLVAEHSAALRPHFVLPAVPADLPRRVADKHWLFDFCRHHDIPAPATHLLDTGDDLERALEELRFPLVVKTTALRASGVTTALRASGGIAQSRRELRQMCGQWVEPFRVVVQEYLPDEVSEDWIVHGYCDERAEMKVAFTGRKVRSWPPRTGATARAYVETNTELLALAASLCCRIGYRGVFDLDWRLDRRTGRYNLLDFNPRVGAQFRMFEDDAGVDVVRAMHLDLSGRQVPAGRVRDGQGFIVEPFDLASRWVDRHRPATTAASGVRTGGARLAWSALDDPVPVLAMVVRQGLQSVATRLRSPLGTAGAARHQTPGTAKGALSPGPTAPAGRGTRRGR